MEPEISGVSDIVLNVLIVLVNDIWTFVQYGMYFYKIVSYSLVNIWLNFTVLRIILRILTIPVLHFYVRKSTQIIHSPLWQNR